MGPAFVILIALVGVVSGAIGWRRSTSYIYRRSVNDPVLPAGVTRREYDRAVRRSRKRRRLFIAVAYAVVGAALAAAVLFGAIRR